MYNNYGLKYEKYIRSSIMSVLYVIFPNKTLHTLQGVKCFFRNITCL